MSKPDVMRLADGHLHLRARGPSEWVSSNWQGMVETGRIEELKGSLIWDPCLDGVLIGEAEQAEKSDHHGERHLDGDEILYVISGAIRLALEEEGGPIREIVLRAGETTIVPQGVWHRLLIDEPARYLFIGGGRTEVRTAPAG